jgi:uroporphyrinogen decarboxylase
MDDFISIGVDAIHPIEPKAMDVVELKKKVKNKMALLGSVDLDFPLTRGTPEHVHQYVKKRIAQIAPGGGFAIGSSNSITHYVPLVNYKTMLDTVKKYGKYPIKR